MQYGEKEEDEIEEFERVEVTWINSEGERRKKHFLPCMAEDLKRQDRMACLRKFWGRRARSSGEW